MRRWLCSVVLFLAGCSTHPVADFMDHFFPAKIDPNAAAGRSRGGVCDPPVGSPVAPNTGRGPTGPGMPPPGALPPAPGMSVGPGGLPPVDPPPVVPPR